eukprot:gene5213-8825_t
MNRGMKTLTQRINNILYSVGGSRSELEKLYNAPYFNHSVWVTDLQFHVIWMNNYFLDTYGYSETEFASGENFAKVFKDLNPQEPNFFAYVQQTQPKEYNVHLKNVLTMTGEKKNVTYSFKRLDSVFNILPLFYIIEVFEDKVKMDTQEKVYTTDFKDINVNNNNDNTLKWMNTQSQSPPKKKIRKMSISNLLSGDSSPKLEEQKNFWFKK